MGTIINIPLTYTKDELLAALAERRKAAEKVDAKALAEHKKAERKHLAEFKARCREGLKWDYETLKEKGTHGLFRGLHHAPRCPRSQVSVIDSLIAMVKKVNQPRFTISANGRWHQIYAVLTEDVPEVTGLC